MAVAAPTEHKDVTADDLLITFHTESEGYRTNTLNELFTLMKRRASEGFYGCEFRHCFKYLISVLSRHDFIVIFDNGHGTLSWTNDVNVRKAYGKPPALIADEWAYKLCMTAKSARSVDNIYTRVIDAALRQKDKWGITSEGQRFRRIEIPNICDDSTIDAILSRMRKNGFGLACYKNKSNDLETAMFNTFSFFWALEIGFDPHSITADEVEAIAHQLANDIL